MQIFYVTLAALAPVAVLMWYICRKDSNQPEPTKLLIKAFIYGVASALLTLAVVMPFGMLTGFGQELSSTISGAFTDAFLMAAIPEELAKFVMLWLLLRNNPYFDEHFDGIVYAVCIGMGFAGFENVLYLFDNYESWISVGIARAMFTVPGHFLTAVIMGLLFVVAFPNRTQQAHMRINTDWSNFSTRNIRRHTVLNEYRRIVKLRFPRIIPLVLQQVKENRQKSHRRIGKPLSFFILPTTKTD